MNQIVKSLFLGLLGLIPWIFWVRAHGPAYWLRYTQQLIGRGKIGVNWGLFCRTALAFLTSGLLFAPAIWTTSIIITPPALTACYLSCLLGVSFFASGLCFMLAAVVMKEITERDLDARSPCQILEDGSKGR